MKPQRRGLRPRVGLRRRVRTRPRRRAGARRTGIVVPPNDIPALARALHALIASPALAQAMGAAGRARAEREFSLPRMLDRVEAVYHEASFELPGRLR